MNLRQIMRSSLAFSLAIVLFAVALSPRQSAAYNTSPPSQPVRLIFIHHSSGENWLNDGTGELAIALRDNNYFVSDTNYGWGPAYDSGSGTIGDHTDIGNWWDWFRGPDSATYLSSLYPEYRQTFEYSRLDTTPAGDNEIIMFKSCFPNSALQGSVSDPVPPIGSNPLRGQDSGSEYHTISNAKGIYMDLLNYFQTRQDKLFIVITAPPLSDPTYAANARAFNQWLVNSWLSGYPYHNVAVFDFYNVLTSNGGDINTNDLGAETGNHHRWWGGAIQHKTDGGANTAAYDSGDGHPTPAGNQKATGEFPALLNIFYHYWKDTGNMACVEGTPMVCYNSLRNAYDYAGTGDTIRARGLSFNEDLTANSSKQITINGGYDATFTDATGVTTLNGSLTIRDGSLTVGNLVIGSAGP